MAIGLRTPDYNELLPAMLQKLDEANRTILTIWVGPAILTMIISKPILK